MNKLMALACGTWLIMVGMGASLHAGESLDPLRDVVLKQPLAGPEVLPESLKGKVVFFEYWGFS